MGCDCDKRIEEVELQNNDNTDNNDNYRFKQFNIYPQFEKQNRTKTIGFHNSSKAFYGKEKLNLDYLATISENNETMNKEEKNQDKNIIEEDENEDEENIDKTRPTDKFSQYLFDEINKLREDPHSYIELIQNSESNIQTDKNKRLIYKSKVKVALIKGLKAFEEAKLFLSNTKPMEKLIYDYQIAIKVPKNEKDIKNKNYLKNQILIKSDNGINIKTYWREIIYDPETCFILMIVDDNGKKSGNKRRDILNPKYKYIGISSIMINKSFACYITLK